jgi:hypothetical protein
LPLYLTKTEMQAFGQKILSPKIELSTQREMFEMTRFA